jgi:hypothetical protein
LSSGGLLYRPFSAFSIGSRHATRIRGQCSRLRRVSSYDIPECSRREEILYLETISTSLICVKASQLLDRQMGGKFLNKSNPRTRTSSVAVNLV